MKIKLTEKFSIKRKGDVIDVSEVTAKELIAEGKATAAGNKDKSEAKESKETKVGKEAKEKEQAPEADEPKTDAENIVIE